MQHGRRDRRAVQLVGEIAERRDADALSGRQVDPQPRHLSDRRIELGCDLLLTRAPAGEEGVGDVRRDHAVDQHGVDRVADSPSDVSTRRASASTTRSGVTTIRTDVCTGSSSRPVPQWPVQHVTERVRYVGPPDEGPVTSRASRTAVAAATVFLPKPPLAGVDQDARDVAGGRHGADSTCCRRLSRALRTIFSAAARRMKRGTLIVGSTRSS